MPKAAPSAHKLKTRRVVALGPGLHAGVLERARGDGGYVVRLATGDAVNAELDAGCARALADECLRARRTVLLAEVAGAPVILGALQTTPSVRVDDAGNATLAGKHVSLEAADRVSLKVGASVVTLDRDGALRIQGDRLTIDVGALVKILSANVSLP